MSTKLAAIKKINQLRTDTVFGYIKCIIEEFNGKIVNVPDIVYLLCLLYLNDEEVEIELEYVSHRGHHASYHPKNLLNDNYSQSYGSEVLGRFKENEADWMIFKMKYDYILYYPTKFAMINWETDCAVKKMKLWIGNMDDDKWFDAMDSSEINLNWDENLQEIKLIQKDQNQFLQDIQRNHCTYLKLEFLENQGNDMDDFCAYACLRFILYGIESVSFE